MRTYQNCEKTATWTCYFAQGSAPQDLRLATAFFEEHRPKVCAPHRSVTCVPWSLRWATGVLRHPQHHARAAKIVGGHPGRQAKRNGGEDRRPTILRIFRKPIKPSRSTPILAVGPLGILPAESGSRAAPPSVALPVEIFAGRIGRARLRRAACLQIDSAFPTPAGLPPASPIYILHTGGSKQRDSVSQKNSWAQLAANGGHARAGNLWSDRHL
jgi:hypothetical protein